MPVIEIKKMKQKADLEKEISRLEIARLRLFCAAAETLPHLPVRKREKLIKILNQQNISWC